MSEKRAKSVKAAKPAKAAKPGKPAVSRKRTTVRQDPSHEQIAERAYFIHLQESGSDELGNWLRAERELTAA